MPLHTQESVTSLSRTIVTPRELEYEKHCKGDFREYVHVHIDGDVTNVMRRRTFPDLLLGPTSNM